MVLEMLSLQTFLEEREIKLLYSRVHAQVDDAVPPVSWVGSKVLMGKRVFQVCPGTVKLTRAMSRREWMCQNLWGSGS